MTRNEKFYNCLTRKGLVHANLFTGRRAPAHKAKVVQAWCKSELPEFISAEEWPALSPKQGLRHSQPQFGFEGSAKWEEWDEIDDNGTKSTTHSCVRSSTLFLRLRAVVRAKGGRIEKQLMVVNVPVVT
ncbi:unnamed protein product [Haemonchus placei]|uniref:HTH CENPB-type domain-containing protein n=1 Tax=Haemonchus placei TaxID=6290 RepID=A0A0N4WXB8_HAEPC|nr:unnamed protein product [Haemonchus placei]